MFIRSLKALAPALCVATAAVGGCASIGSPAADPAARPHDFTTMSLLTRPEADAPRPDYVLVRVEVGAPHYDGGPPQPVLETQFLSADAEGSTVYRTSEDTVSIVAHAGGAAEPQAAVVADRVRFGTELHVVSMPRHEFPAGHEDVQVPEPAEAATPPDAGATAKLPVRSYRTEARMDHAGSDAVDLTFLFQTRSNEVLLREVAATTLRVHYGQSVLFPTRRAPGAAR